MDIRCGWCEKTYAVTINNHKARKKIGKKGYMKTRCPTCKTINPVSGVELGILPEKAGDRSQGTGWVRPQWVNSIQFQTTAIVLLLVTFILGSFHFYNYRSTRNRMQNTLAESSNNTAHQLAKYLAAPLWGVETEAIADALASEMLDRNIYAIEIIDLDRKGVLVGKKRDANWQVQSTNEKIDGDFIAAENDITHKNEVIGKVRLWVTQKFMKEELGRLSLNLGITTLALFAAIIAGVFITLQKIIVHPIMALTNAADRMSRGDLDTQITIRSKNELGTLVNALKRMQTSLIFSLKKLRQKSS